MKSKTGAIDFSTQDLERLQQQLDLWRGQQFQRTRLPEQVWRAAVELARSLGVSYVSRRLRLSYVQLRRRLGERAERPRSLGKTSFVEVALANDFGPSPGYRAELSEGCPEKLTLHLGGDLQGVLALAEAFWRRKG